MKLGDVVWVVQLKDGHLAWANTGEGLDVSMTKEEAERGMAPTAKAVPVRLLPVTNAKEAEHIPTH